MPSNLPPEITSGLTALRRRIRRIQLSRGLLRTLTVVLGGLFVLVALDYFLAPLPGTARAILFFAWIAGAAYGFFRFLLRPITRKIPLVRLARWLEERHPEVQERISTALEPRVAGKIQPFCRAEPPGPVPPSDELGQPAEASATAAEAALG